MNTLNQEIVISYSWHNSDYDAEDIKESHIDALKETAEEHIFEMIEDGILRGELHDNIRMDDDDPEDGIEYCGYWEIIRRQL